MIHSDTKSYKEQIDSLIEYVNKSLESDKDSIKRICTDDNIPISDYLKIRFGLTLTDAIELGIDENILNYIQCKS